MIRSLTPVAILFVALLVSGCQDALVSDSGSDRSVQSEVDYEKKLPETMDQEDLTLASEFTEEFGEPVDRSTQETSALSWESDFGTSLNPRDDECDKVSVGFSFDFYGSTYEELWVNSNGNITLNECNRQWWHPDVPDGDNVLIAPLYGDLYPPRGGDVFVNTTGSPPNRVFVVTWVTVPEFSVSGDSGPNTFQVQLFEGSNKIQFGYRGLSTDGINWGFMDPSDDPKMDVGISSGNGSFINSASGSAIPALDTTNICYVPDAEGGYVERARSCANPNRVPVADAGPDQTVECTGDSTSVTLDGSGSSDPDGDQLTYSWSLNGTQIATGPTPTVNLPDGSHTITLTVTDPIGASDSDKVVVDIVDTTSPTLSYRTVSTRLWPPNHTMKRAVADLSASDICDSDPDLTVTVSSNEPVNGRGDGNTTPDWKVVKNQDGTVDVFLRAERSGVGSGRTYTVTMTAEDAAGNVTTEIVEVEVPHNQ